MTEPTSMGDFRRNIIKEMSKEVEDIYGHVVTCPLCGDIDYEKSTNVYLYRSPWTYQVRHDVDEVVPKPFLQRCWAILTGGDPTVTKHGCF